jgi:hypothetical protein
MPPNPRRRRAQFSRIFYEENVNLVVITRKEPIPGNSAETMIANGETSF